VRLVHAAADLEERTEKHIAMENRLSPMREMLGEMLLAVGEPGDALREFEGSLRVAPNRYRSIAGAAKAAKSIGDRQTARAWCERLLQLTAEADTERSEITAARTFLANQTRSVFKPTGTLVHPGQTHGTEPPPAAVRNSTFSHRITGPNTYAAACPRSRCR
jgi:hypothetical protein